MPFSCEPEQWVYAHQHSDGYRLDAVVRHDAVARPYVNILPVG